MQVGNDVEKDLIEGDVLTMGGEPTLFLLMTLKVLNGILLLTVL
jgi:uncharacterized protein (DUF2126 family)